MKLDISLIEFHAIIDQIKINIARCSQFSTIYQPFTVYYENNNVMFRVWADDINEGNENYRDRAKIIIHKDKLGTTNIEGLYLMLKLAYEL